MDENFKFIELKERNLSFVHATFFHGKKLDAEDTSRILIPETDIRVIVQTADQADPNSDLFKYEAFFFILNKDSKDIMVSLSTQMFGLRKSS